MRIFQAFSALATALTICASASFAATGEITGQASVIDGDTIEIHAERIRLNGIDAPESDQHCTDADGKSWRCGAASAWHLDETIAQQVVTCQVLSQDRYGRHIADCFINRTGMNLNANLVEAGLAVAYRQYSMKYVPQEEAAYTSRRGMWQGQFMMPWDYRRQ